MRITKYWLSEAKAKLVKRQAALCALAATDNAIKEEWKRRFPHSIAGCPEDKIEVLKQLLQDDLEQVLPFHLLD